jgi:hypothetical protein
MPQQSYHHQKNMTKSASATASKTPQKSLNASEKLQHVPEERSQRKKNWAIRLSM